MDLVASSLEHLYEHVFTNPAKTEYYLCFIIVPQIGQTGKFVISFNIQYVMIFFKLIKDYTTSLTVYN